MDTNQTSSFDIFADIEASTNNDELGEQITLLSARMNVATYQIIKLIAVFDRRDGWYGAGIRSCAHWLLPMEERGDVVLPIVPRGNACG